MQGKSLKAAHVMVSKKPDKKKYISRLWHIAVEMTRLSCGHSAF